MLDKIKTNETKIKRKMRKEINNGLLIFLFAGAQREVNEANDTVHKKIYLTASQFMAKAKSPKSADEWQSNKSCHFPYQPSSCRVLSLE